MRMLIRLVRLWAAYARLDFLFVTQDGRRFLTFMVSDLVVAIGGLSAMVLLTARFEGIGQWTRDQAIFMVGYGQVVGVLVASLFGYNLGYISRRLGRGQLDHSLIQPLPLVIVFLTEGFTPFSNTIALVPGAALMIWSAWAMHLALTPGWLGLLLVSMAGSIAVTMGFNFIWGTLAFWAPRGAEELSSETNQVLNQLRGFPLDGLGLGAQVGLLTVVPVGFIAWYPSRALLGINVGGGASWLTPLAGCAFLALAAVVFRFGLARYTQTGSSRYSDFGHRR
jgi:ABC-2 type transport system permease protein